MKKLSNNKMSARALKTRNWPSDITNEKAVTSGMSVSALVSKHYLNTKWECQYLVIICWMSAIKRVESLKWWGMSKKTIHTHTHIHTRDSRKEPHVPKFAQFKHTDKYLEKRIIIYEIILRIRKSTLIQ